MTLTLRAVSLNDQPLTQPITAQFGAEGGTIGRADQNTLALPDPERHISRRQAEISVHGDSYAIKNIGSANPIIVHGQPLAQGVSAALTHHDQVRIGGYLLEVIDDGLLGTDTTTVTRPRAAPAEPKTPMRTAAALAAAQLAAPPQVAPLSSSNPFADLLGPAPAAAPMQAGAVPAAAKKDDPFADLPPPAGLSGASAAWAAAAPAAPKLPDDFDPFAASAPAAASPQPAPAAGGAGVFDDLIPSAAAPSIDEAFGLQQAGSSQDPLAAFMAGGAAPGAGSEPGAASGLSTDPLALFGGTKGEAPDMPTAPDDAPELRGAFKPPGLRDTPDPLLPSGLDWLGQSPKRPAAAVQMPATVPPMPATARSNQAQQPVHAMTPPETPAAGAGRAAANKAAASAEAGTWAGDTQELWRAFCEGAGLRLALPQGLNPELMRVMGKLLRAAVEGTLKLMAVRAATKHELHAQVTVIQARNNNPLKFSPDAQTALEQMLQPPMRGFLPGPAAMTDAMQDLVSHAIGTMAGTRSALEGVLGRFAPSELEAKLVGKSVLDSLLPMNRKAKLWELYLQHFEGIRSEAQEDFQTLFGRAFLAAYEQQLERLKREKSDP